MAYNATNRIMDPVERLKNWRNVADAQQLLDNSSYVSTKLNLDHDSADGHHANIRLNKMTQYVVQLSGTGFTTNGIAVGEIGRASCRERVFITV